jgi:hypothetical protein
VSFKSEFKRGFKSGFKCAQSRHAKAGISGGGGGIRTPGTRKGTHDFESCAFNQALPPLRG